MNYKKISRYVVLGILFFLPVTFLLFLYPATHNYKPLDIINDSVSDLNTFNTTSEEKVLLKDHITVLGFLGNNPLNNSIAASNLKELVYDNFKGFKKFQVVIVLPVGAEKAAEKLETEINAYEDLRFWHFVFGEPNDINNLFLSLKSVTDLDENLSTNRIFIVDKDLNQRGRLDDRTDNEISKKVAPYILSSYDCIEVAEIKNKMSDDMRILFTEYRQRRKGEFNSETRRASDLKGE